MQLHKYSSYTPDGDIIFHEGVVAETREKSCTGISINLTFIGVCMYKETPIKGSIVSQGRVT